MADQHPRKKRKRSHEPGLFQVGDKVVDFRAIFREKPKPAVADKDGDAINNSNDATSSVAAVEKNQDIIENLNDAASSSNYRRPITRAPKNQTISPNTLNTAYSEARQALPIWDLRTDICKSLAKDNDVLLITGETGSGKSTQVPQFLCNQRWCRRKPVKVASPGGQEETVSVGGIIAVTQPRRVAALTLATRVAQEMGTPLKPSGTVPRPEGHVGYSVRFDHNIPKGTKIKYLTEGMLLQELLRDPHLRQYSAVVVDEIHERSVDVDLIAGFLKKIVFGDKSGRGGVPLKVVIMSATTEVDVVRDFFSKEYTEEDKEGDAQSHRVTPSRCVPVNYIHIKGRQFPVDLEYTSEQVPDIEEALLDQITKIHQQEPFPGDILAFLLGQEAIESAQKRIEEYSAGLASDLPQLLACPLYGQLSIQAQQIAFQPAPKKFTRKVILATNIAETSVTVPGVKYVIDSGKAKVKQFRSQLGFETLLAKPISKSSALQRMGRAGREGPGKCFRLYTKTAYDELNEAALPEILRNDILGAILTMMAYGIQDIGSFPFIDPPEPESVRKGLMALVDLGAIDGQGRINKVGRKLACLPVSPLYGRVLIAAGDPKFDCMLEAIDVISVLSSGEIFHRLFLEDEQEDIEEARNSLHRREGDILTYLTTMQQYTAENADRNEWCRKRKINMRNMRQALEIRRQLRTLCQKDGLLSKKPLPDPQPFVPLPPERAEKLLKCFLTGFATKCALLMPNGKYLTTETKQEVFIHPSSVLHMQQPKSEAIMFLEHVFTRKSYAKRINAVTNRWVVDAYDASAQWDNEEA